MAENDKYHSDQKKKICFRAEEEEKTKQKQ